MKGRPVKAAAPTVWVDTPAGPGASVAGPAGTGTFPGGTTTKGAKVTGPGSGTSVASTSLVERIARAYLAMTGAQLIATPLRAQWNPGGTYASAFNVPGPGTLSQSPQTSELVYVGEISSVYKGKTGYLLTLTYRHADGNELRIWLQNAVAAHPAGQALWKKLQNGQIAPGMLAFALGSFIRQTTSGAVIFYSLPVVDARRVWIVGTTEVQAVLSPGT